MNKGIFSWALFAMLGIAVWPAQSADYAGDYVAVDDSSLTLSIEVSDSGSVTGMLSDYGDRVPMQAQLADDVLTGRFGDPEEAMTFTGKLSGEQLVLDVGDDDYREQIIFLKAGSAAAAQSSGDSAPARGEVRINGQVLDAAALARAQQLYGLQIPPGDYWYDPVLGAWGVTGGPTYGFIAPGLDLGGPLPAGASGGGTAIFVNGRELHPYDVYALQSVTGPIMPGRYFITSEGLAGYEGGPPLWNLLALAAQSGGGGGGSGGGSNTWQSRITGASGFSDGNSGAVFLPNGGIVSY